MQQQFLIPRNVGNYTFNNEVEENKWTAFDQQTNNEVYIQLISKKDYQTPDASSKLTKYTESMKNLNSKYFSKCLESFEDKRYFYFVFEKPEGITLNEYVFRNRGKITEEYIKVFFTNLITSFQDMINKNVQLSITYNNIFVNNCNVFNLKDFKLSIIPYMMKYDVNPSFVFEAPEVLLGKIKDSVSNVWTCGILLYFITTGSIPFSVAPFNQEEFQKIILNVEIQVPLYVPSEIKDLLIRTIVKNPSSRIKFDQMFDHFWLNKESVKQTAKTYSHIDMDQFPTLWAQPNFLKECPKNDFARSHKIKVQVVSRPKSSRFHIEKITKQ